MQSTRLEDYGTRPPRDVRSRDPRIQKGPSDHYLMQPHEVTERPHPPRRSSSPPRRVVGTGERRNGSFEERDFYRPEVRGEREDPRFQSAHFGRSDQRSTNYDENYISRDDSRRKYDDLGNELNTGFKRGGHGGLRGNFDGEKVSGVVEHQLMGDRRMFSEHGSMHIRDAEDGRQFLLPSRNPDDGRFNNDQDQYPDPLMLKKMAAIDREERNVERLADMERIERYENVEEMIAKHRDVPYFKGSASSSQQFPDMSRLREFDHNPLRSSRMNILGSYEDDVRLPTEFHPSNSAQHVEHYHSDRLLKRQGLERRDFAANHDDVQSYRRTEFGPPIYDDHQQDYMYSRHESGENRNHSHTSEELSKKLHYHEQRSYYRGDNISPNVVNPTKQQHVTNADYSQRLHGGRDSWNHPNSRNRSPSYYIRDDRSFTTGGQAGMYWNRRNTFDEFDDKVLSESEVPPLEIPTRGYLSHRRITDVSDGDALLVSGRESIRTPLGSRFEIEMQDHDLRRKGIDSDGLYGYDPSRKSFKRKQHHLDEELSYYPTNSTLPNRQNNLNGEHQQDRDDKWNFEKESDLLSSKSLKFSENINPRTGRTVYYGGDSTSYDVRFSDDQDEYLKEYSSKPFKPAKKTLQGFPRYGLSNSYNQSSSSQRHSFRTNVWVRAKDEKQSEEPANETWESNIMGCSSEPGAAEDLEDSEEFKQLVQEFFLSFSKILNEKIGTRRRYKEQGRAGSLFCIVCGKSSSKEFLDTRSLATHCYMSQKVGLRARHLGLHKAICVLLGWNSVVDRDVTTFAPQIISSSEALAQKEDLILWPPTFIIHHISMSASHMGEQNVFTKEQVEDFLRGKGVSVGKIKVTPGISPNNDIMVVKFLGTFPGLQDAKNLHNHFVDEKHGRTDFEQMLRNYNTRKERTPADESQEPLFYGYIGISEDLDKVDFDTRRRCTIKSMKDIEYIAEAPLTQ